MIAVSACLVGKNVKYNGGNNYNIKVIEYLKDKDYILICPETFGELPTPRVPSEQKGDFVFASDGTDVTKEFNKGALKAYQMIKENKCDEVILKARSPSCGYKKIYDGSFSRTIIDGNGVLVKMLLNENIKILTELDF